MLSRVADSLYWMARYLERAEHTARLFDVNLHLMLDQAAPLEDARWRRLLGSLNLPPSEEAPEVLVRRLSLDAGNRSSIVACIASTRENARQVREQISSEMWEQINRLFLRLQGLPLPDTWDAQWYEFYREVKEGIQLFYGITDATLSRNEGWHFLQAGRYLERAIGVTRLLAAHLLPSPEQEPEHEKHRRWVELLRSCTAFEAYCRQFTADLRADRIAGFLLLSPDFPHSVHFSAIRMQQAVEALCAELQSRNPARIVRLAGRLRASLGFSNIDEVLAGGLSEHLDLVQGMCGQIHTMLYQVFISYQIDTSLAG